MINIRSIYAILASLVLLVAVPNGLRAQSIVTGEVSGSVVDATGGAVVNARVTLENIATGVTEQPVHTTATGNFVFPLLKPGSYMLRVSTPNFHTMISKVEVEVGSIANVHFKLEVGAAAETVEVSAQAPLLQTDNGDVGATVTESQVANIPNPGNDLTYTAQVTPGTTMNNGGGGYGNFSSFGMSAVSNLFTLDGMDDNDPFLNLNDSGATNLMLGLNEVDEVTVVGDGYSGVYGGLAGANVNIVTHGGTNAFHGHGIWQWNGSSLDANNWFNNATETPKSFVNANQYGGDIGGPIVKKKLFFYFDAEGLYLLIPTSVQALVPSTQYATAVQANINSTYGANSMIAKFYQNVFKLYSEAPGSSAAENTLNDDGCDGSEYYFNPHISSALPAADHGFGDHDAMDNPLGTGTPCALTYFSNIGNGTHENLQAGRVDWTISDHDRFFMRVQHDLGEQASVTDPINKLFNLQSNQPEWQGQIEEAHDFAKGAVNQLIISGQWYSAIFGAANPAATNAAFPGSMDWGGGQFSALGGIDFFFPQGRRVTQFQLSDDFAKPFGAHTFKIGVKYRRNWVTNTDYSSFSNGLLIPVTLDGFFDGGTDAANPCLAGTACTLPPGQTAVLPNISEIEQSFPTATEQPFGLYTIGGYLEDDWKVRPNFTLTLAFRGDHAAIPNCFHNCFAAPVTQFPDLNNNPDTPYNQIIAVNETYTLPSLTAFEPQPRIGFAWTIHNTVVRGGAGLFYDNYPGVLLDQYSENPPLDPQFTVTTGNLSSASDPNSLYASAAASNAAFQAGFKAGQSFNQISALVPGFSPPGLASSDTYPKVPQYQKWNLEIEHAFGPNTSFSVEYVGNHGVHILDLNSGINGCNYTGTFDSLPACNVGGSGLNPSFSGTVFAESIGVASYNGVTASFTHRYKSGQVQINYTYSHTLDDESNSGEEAFSSTSFGATNESVLSPENPFDPQANYGDADQDIRHELTANFVWELPIKRFLAFGHGPDSVLNGWDVNGFFVLRTGFPETLLDGATSSSLLPGGYGTGTYSADVFGTELKAGGTGANCETEFGAAEPNSGICLNTNDFTTSGNGFGNVGRNTIIGPTYWNADFSLMKHIPVYERAELVIGAQFFNVFNHPNFDAPITDTSNSRFGEIIRTVSPPTSVFGSVLGADASPRLIQLKLEADF